MSFQNFYHIALIVVLFPLRNAWSNFTPREQQPVGKGETSAASAAQAGAVDIQAGNLLSPLDSGSAVPASIPPQLRLEEAGPNSGIHLAQPDSTPAAAPEKLKGIFPIPFKAADAPEHPVLGNSQNGQETHPPSNDTPADGLAESTDASLQQLPGNLGTLYKELQAAFESPYDASSRLPEVQTPTEIIRPVRQNLSRQIRFMKNRVPKDKLVLLRDIQAEGESLLDEIFELLARNEVDPHVPIRTSEDDGETKPIGGRELRIGIYPVAADPFHWGHLLIALRAIADRKLDKVVFILQGKDERKPDMTAAAIRHPMGQYVINQFAPFLAYSSIAQGTTYDGEMNMFRLLGLNPEQEIRAFYLVGGDHSGLTDARGNPDTLPKIQKNLENPELRPNPRIHSVEVVFIRRGDEDLQNVWSPLKTHLLPNTIESSSTQVRQGNHALMPAAAYWYIQKNEHLHGLYGVPSPSPTRKP